MEDAVSEDPQIPQFWALQYLCFAPGDERDEARRATALNFCTSADAGLVKDWEKQFESVLAKLKGEAPSNVTAFKPRAVDGDNTG